MNQRWNGARRETLHLEGPLKKPHFPEPGGPERSPYRDPSRVDDEVELLDPPRGVVVSRPEPPEEVSLIDPKGTSPMRVLSPKERREHARALLALDTAKHPRRLRARLLIVPVTLFSWRKGVFAHDFSWLLYPLLLLSVVIVILEVRRAWRGTDG